MKGLYADVNLMDPGKCGFYLALVIFTIISKIYNLSISCAITLRWMQHDLTDE